MLNVTAALPDRAHENEAIVLIHGAANSGRIWTYWQRALADAGWRSYAIDLRGHGASDPMDLSRTTMRDYADDVAQLCEDVGRPSGPAVMMGWSMGGLVAMMQAADEAEACIALAPSMPAEARDETVELREGEFGAEEYGITSLDPDAEQPAMPDLDREERAIALASLGRESRYARDERKAGIVVEVQAGPLLIVTGSADTQWPRERYDGLWLPHEHLVAEGASHWGLVLNRRELSALAPSVVGWLERVTA